MAPRRRDARQPFPVPPAPAGIRVTTDLLTCIIAFDWRYVSIDDGEPRRLHGRGELVAVEPGWHKVRCFIGQSYLLRLGDSSVTVFVPHACVVSLKWSWHGDLSRGRFRRMPP